jgi:coenzyme F420-reducing hydrogenase delta subunit/NAD-dependent dihydropyrimidine dehydrogenase PreA subunit
MCSGRVDLAFILRALSKGMDGVFVGGCRLDECNYVTQGNYDALNIVLLCKRIMEYIGLNPDRLRIEFMTAGDGILLTEVTNDFVRQVKELGPLGEAEELEKDELKSRLEEVTRLVPYIKIAKREKLASRLKKVEDYESLFTPDEIGSLFRDVVSYHIDPEKCKACMICLRRCPADAIIGGKNQIHVIDQEKCIKCGTCFEACPPRFGAVNEISGAPVPPPIPEKERAIARN